MPHGVELIIQGKNIRVNDMNIKLSICKRFGGKLQADHWYEEVQEDIKKAMGKIGEVCKRGDRDE